MSTRRGHRGFAKKLANREERHNGSGIRPVQRWMSPGERPTLSEEATAEEATAEELAEESRYEREKFVLDQESDSVMDELSAREMDDRQSLSEVDPLYVDPYDDDFDEADRQDLEEKFLEENWSGQNQPERFRLCDLLDRIRFTHQE